MFFASYIQEFVCDLHREKGFNLVLISYKIWGGLHVNISTLGMASDFSHPNCVRKQRLDLWGLQCQYVDFKCDT